MQSLRPAFLIVAIIFFVLATFCIEFKDSEGHPKFNLVAAGLAFTTAALLL